MKDKILVYRNATLRSIYGGYGRIVEDSVVGNSVYIRKNTVFTVVSINLWTQSILAVNQATKETLSLEYDYILNNCEVAGNPKNTIIDCVAIIDTTEQKPEFNLLKLIAIVSILNLLGIAILTLH
jgi:hypothetical protein